eukprot:7658940-Lingulodinium_polyedra.AAC.1
MHTHTHTHTHDNDAAKPTVPPQRLGNRTPRTLHANTKNGVRMECMRRAMCGGVFGCCLGAASALL